MAHVFSFERPVVELVARVRELRELATEDARLAPELSRLEEKAARVAREVFAKLTPMQKVQLSRHPNRPYTMDYIARLFDDWIELAGDRRFANDASIVGGIGRYHGRSVVVVGHQKGRTTKENMVRNFGMPNPEGYRKAIRLYQLADRFRLPVLTFIDTPGAYPGIEAEERGQSEAIGASLEVMSCLGVPSVTTIIGEGGFGRRPGVGRDQSRAGVGVLLLLRDHARGLRRNPVEGRQHGAGSRPAAEDHRAGSARARLRGRHRGRAPRRRAP